MNKCLVCIIGECFREGHNQSRITDTQYGYTQQKESTQSHINLINKIKKLGYHVDIGINTYNTNYKNELLNWYPNIIYSNFTNENYGYYQNVVHHSLQNIFNNININDYQFIFIIRFDLFIKETLINIFNPNWSNIMYPFAVYMEYSPFQFPFVSDTMCFIPKKYFNQIVNHTYHLLTHHCWRDLINNGFVLDDFDVMINTLHNPNTDTEKNPLYIINCRPEFQNHFLQGIYDKKTNNIII
jgi:hypothetical protein